MFEVILDGLHVYDTYVGEQVNKDALRRQHPANWQPRWFLEQCLPALCTLFGRAVVMETLSNNSAMVLDVVQSSADYDQLIVEMRKCWTKDTYAMHIRHFLDRPLGVEMDRNGACRIAFAVGKQSQTIAAVVCSCAEEEVKGQALAKRRKQLGGEARRCAQHLDCRGLATVLSHLLKHGMSQCDHACCLLVDCLNAAVVNPTAGWYRDI